MKKIIFFTRYSRLGASSRLRTFQYLPYFKNDFDIQISPLFDDEYLKRLYSGKSTIYFVVKAYIRRFFILFKVNKYELVWIEKELFPYLPAWVEKCLQLIKKPYVVDYDDAIFHNYDLSNNFYKKILSKKIDKVMKNSSLVLVGNNYLKDRAVKSGAINIEVLPTVVDLTKYTRREINPSNDKLVIGWIGTPYTVKYLNKITPIIDKLSEKYKLTLRVIGATEGFLNSNNIEYVQWSEETEAKEIQKFDIGIMPLNYSPWEMGKCGYKLIQYMACGIPVIASPIGVNIDIINNTKSGFLATNDDDWITSFEKLFASKKLRVEMGRNGQKAIERYYCTQVQAPRLIELLKKI